MAVKGYGRHKGRCGYIESYFKRVLRECRREEARLREEALATKLADKQMKDYWRLTRGKKNMKLAAKINGTTGDEAIAEVWRSKFKAIFNSGHAPINNENLRHEFHEFDFLTISDMKKSLSSLSVNKAIGADDIPAEVFRSATPRLVTFLTILVNGFFRHSFIPDVVMKVILVPLLKNKLKDASLSESYRPIAIATAFSKVIENVILQKCEQHLTCHDNQFGFKKKHSTDLCIYTLKEAINYYTRLGSPVFICFLDIEKAFDKINHRKLFQKLIKRKVPMYLVRLLIYWYVSQTFVVKWGNGFSSPFTISNGIRQGGIISPFLFNVYMDSLSDELLNLGVGCYIRGVCINHICFADDMVVLAPSAKALQQILNACTTYAAKYDIKYSVGDKGKSKCMVCWPQKYSLKFLPVLYLAEIPLEFVNEYEYLGYTVSCDQKDDLEIGKRTRKMYSSGNMIINKFRNSNNSVKVTMFKTYFSCIYASVLWNNYKVGSYMKMKIAHNDIFRYLLNVPRYESASALFVTHSVKNLDSLLRYNMISFMNRLKMSTNNIISAVSGGDCRVHSNIWKQFSIKLGAEDTVLYW